METEVPADVTDALLVAFFSKLSEVVRACL